MTSSPSRGAERLRIPQDDAVAAAIFRGLLTGTQDGILVLGVEGDLLHANRVAREWTGLPPDCPERVDIRSLVPADEVPRVDRALERAGRGEALRDTFTVLARDGAKRRVEVTVTGIEPQDGERVVLVCRDVTEREREQERLRTIAAIHDTVKRLATAHEAAEAGLHVVRRHIPMGAASILVFNPLTRTLAFESAVGLPSPVTDFFSQRVLDVDRHDAHAVRAFRKPGRVLVSPTARARLPAHVRDGLTNMGCRASVATTLSTIDGAPFGVMILGVDHDVPHARDGTLEDPALGAWVRVVAEALGTCMDLLRHNEELRETLKRERRAVDELQSFTYRTSHDLSEPLRGISTLADYAREDLAHGDVAAVDDVLQRIGRSADRLKVMIGSILELIRTAPPTAPVTRWWLVDAVRAVTDEVHPLFTERNARLTVDVPMPMVEAAWDRVRATLKRLVENAILHNTNPAPVVRVSAHERDDGFVEVSVRDNGPGIPEMERDRVFEVFRSGTASASAGVGVGLAIARRAITQEGGHLWVQDAPDGGADFRFTVRGAR